MGTTCTVLVLHPRGALVGHVGDSRAYRVRHRTVDQLSRDHSLAWEIEAAMGVHAEEAGEAVPKNIITRSLGPHAKVDVDLEGPFPIEAGDTFILCSDGLTGVVSDAEIGLFAAEFEPAEAVAALIGLALVRGAPDNVTVIGVRAGEEEVSRKSRGDEPWPLSEEATSTQRQGRWAWASLAAAALGLLLALTVNPWTPLTKDLCDKSDLVRIICLVTSLGGGLLAAGGGLFGTVSFLTATRRGRMLQAGDHLGKGPYRTHDCTPTPGLVDGVVTSLEAVADSLPVAARDRTVGILARARQHAAAGAYHEAVTAVAEAISVHVDEIEAGRRDATDRIEPPPTPPHA
jgi:protein phosphatase